MVLQYLKKRTDRGTGPAKVQITFGFLNAVNEFIYFELSFWGAASIMNSYRKIIKLIFLSVIMKLKK